jgi:integrase
MAARKTGKRRPRGTGGIEILPSGRFRGRWRSLDGRSLSFTGDTKREVTEHIQNALAEQRRTGYDRSPRTVTVATLCDEWWRIAEGSVKPRAAERYDDHLAHIRRLVGDVPISDLSYERVQQFIAELQAVPLAPKTVRSCYAVLALVLQHAQRLGRMQRAIPKPIMPRVRRPVLRIPTRSEVEQLAAASDKRLWAPVLVAGYCGLREGELLALHAADVHLDAAVPWLLVRHARNKTSGAHEETKTERIRRVYLPARVREALEAHLAEYSGELVVPVSASVYQKSFERARTACGLGGVRPHDLRHAAASMMIAADLNVLQVSKQLGHANATQTLDTYGHLWPDSFDQAMERMNAYLAA